MYTGIIQGVHWEPTDKCNSRCPMCPRYVSGVEIPTLANTEWTLEQFQKSWPERFIKELRKILSCGNFGDPCVCKDFANIYEYVRLTNPKIQLCCNTNGSMRNPDWWYKLGLQMRNHGLDYCTFSLDGLEDTNHLYRRGTIWSKIMENVKAYISAGGIAHWDFIVFEHNQHQVEEARQLAKSMGFENFNVKRTTRWMEYSEDTQQGRYPVFDHRGEFQYFLKQPNESKFKPNFEDAKIFIENSKYQSITLDDFKNMKGRKNYDQRYVHGEWKSIETNELTIACRAQAKSRWDVPWNEIYISADGTVAPCCYLGSEPFVDSTKRGVDTNYLTMIELNGGVDTLNMHKHNIYDILETPIFRHYLPMSWDENRSMMPQKCGACCGVEFNGLDFGELGEKHKGKLT